MENFNFKEYQEQCDEMLKNPNFYKVIDTSSLYWDSTKDKLEGLDNIYFINGVDIEVKKHNIDIDLSSNWGLYDENLIPPYKDQMVVNFTYGNPYELKWLLRFDGCFSSDIQTVVTNSTYQTSPWSDQDIQDNPYVTHCVYQSDLRELKNDLTKKVPYWAKTEIGAVACTSTDEYRTCLRGPANKNVDFKEWLISITNPNALILAEDINLVLSIAISGGFAKSLHIPKKELEEKVHRLFRF